MKHHISVTVRVDGGIEHEFDQVLEGKEKARKLINEVAWAISDIDGEWQHEGDSFRRKEPWPGMARCFTK